MKSTLPTLFVFACCLNALSGELTFNASEKNFLDESSGACLLLYDSKKASFAIAKLPNDSFIVLQAPHSLALTGTTGVQADAQKLSLVATQSLASSTAVLQEAYSSFNGGVMASIGISPADRLPAENALSFQIALPVKACAGRLAFKNSESLPLPASPSDYVLSKGAPNDEFRIGLSPDLEFGVKFLAGVKKCDLLDGRAHGDNSFYFAIASDGSSFLQYFFCLLKPGQSFPSTSDAKSGQAEGKCNLLGEGSDFEVGERGFVAISAASWLAEAPPAKPVFDAENAHQGRFSLRLSSLNYAPDDPMQKKTLACRERNIVWFSPVKLKPGGSYSLSAWMKTDAKGEAKVSMFCGEQCLAGNPWQGKGAQCVVAADGDWKRQTLRFKADNPQMLNYRNAGFMISQETRGDFSVWLDDVQLSEGSDAAECPATPLEFGASLAQPYKLFSVQEAANAAIELKFRNNGDVSTNVEIAYSINDYWDKPLAKGTVSTKVPAQGNASAEVKLPALPCGYYRALFSSPDGKLSDEAIFGVYSPIPADDFLPLDWPLAYQADNNIVNPMARKLGFGCSRCWKFKFSDVLPRKGEPSFDELDLLVSRYEKAKINVMPILGTSLSESAIPAWAVERKEKSLCSSPLTIPNASAWKDYAGAVATHFKGRIRAYEILNEPNCWMPADAYFAVLKDSWEALKAADPNSLVIGGCATSDLGREPAPWTSRLIKLGGAKYMDVLSVHMYSNAMPELSLKTGTDKFLAFLHEQLLASGKDVPIWHTEKTYTTKIRGYSKEKHRIPDCYPAAAASAGFNVRDFRAKAEGTLRETLIDAVVGKGPFFWFDNLVDNTHAPNSYLLEFNHTEFDGSPCPEILAANGLARMLQGRSSPKGLRKLGASKYCALFDGPKGALAALWDKDGVSRIKLSERAGNFTICNFFGAETKPSEWLDLGTAPIYLLFDGRNAENAMQAILASEGDGSKLTMPADLEMKNGSIVLAAYPFNKTWRKLDVDVKLQDFPAGWQFANRAASVSLEPEACAQCLFAVSATKLSHEPQTFIFAAEGENFKIAMPPFKSIEALKAALSESNEAVAFETEKGEIKIDGDLSDWNDAGICGAMTFDKVRKGREFWKGPMDLSVAARFRWDSGNLYAAYIVYDDFLERNAPASSAFSSDCVEMFLGLNPNAPEHGAAGPDKRAPTDFQVIFAPGTECAPYKDATAWLCQANSGAEIKTASKKLPYGYSIEAAIPWKALSFKPKSGAILGMTFQASDSDAKGANAEKTVYWTGEWANCITPKLWGKLKLQ